jgi:hypothetical protein
LTAAIYALVTIRFLWEPEHQGSKRFPGALLSRAILFSLFVVHPRTEFATGVTASMLPIRAHGGPFTIAVSIYLAVLNSNASDRDQDRQFANANLSSAIRIFVF